VGTKVMQFVRRAALKFRSTGSGAGRASRSRFVVRDFLRRVPPRPQRAASFAAALPSEPARGRFLALPLHIELLVLARESPKPLALRRCWAIGARACVTLACSGHLRIAWAEGSNSRAISFNCSRNLGAYGGFAFTMIDAEVDE